METIDTYVDKHEIRIPSLCGYTGLHLFTKRSRSTNTIRDVCFLWVGRILPKDNLIQEMIYQEKFRAGISIRPIHTAVKRGSHVKCSFPHIGKFWCKIMSDESDDGRKPYHL